MENSKSHRLGGIVVCIGAPKSLCSLGRRRNGCRETESQGTSLGCSARKQFRRGGGESGNRTHDLRLMSPTL